MESILTKVSEDGDTKKSAMQTAEVKPLEIHTQTNSNTKSYVKQI